MLRKAVILAAAVSMMPSVASAKAQFMAYEGRDQIVQGTGGTRVTSEGVDFWTNGTPPRRYKVIGVINDKRGTGAFSGKAVGSKNIAQLARKAGGDALIVTDDNVPAVAYYPRVLSQMVVIKYLD